MSCFFFFQKDLIRVIIPWKNYREALVWGVPMIPHVATGWLRQGLDRYIINYFYSVYEVGVFSFAMNLANIIVMIGSAFNSTNSITLFQVLSNKALPNEQKRLKLRRQTRIIFLVYLASTLVVLLSMTILTHIALPKYRGSIPYMWVLAINGLGNCIYFLYCNYLFFYGKTKSLMYITLSTSLMHVGLSFALTRFSLYCTAIVYGLMMTLMTVLVIWQAKKLIREHLA
jgi:O-antigen/teichoic acid export membrane protein